MGYKILDTPEAGGAVLTDVEVCRITVEFKSQQPRPGYPRSFAVSASDQRPAIFLNSSS